MIFMTAPLADILRPKKLTHFVGQSHIVGNNKIINQLLLAAKKDRAGIFPSLIFWGPPGVGKTTLARIIASELDLVFWEFSAVSASTKEIQKLTAQSAKMLIFLDEIHRWNKAQQDRLLPHVESGRVILIGATTENPSFSVISPLLSRSRVIVLKQLSEQELSEIANRALKKLKLKIKKDAREFLIETSNGDARILLTTLEIAASLTKASELTTADFEAALQRRALGFDKHGEEFYNVISAFIKSMRASDVNAALYYLARMVAAGQDPLYIARRMVIFASEDVASPTALVVANAVFQACQQIGYPECQENLAAGTVYLATSKKDRSAYNAYMSALEDVQKYGNLPVPMNIRNPVTKLMKEIGYGKGYEKYTKKSLLPEKIKGKKYYNMPEIK